MKIAICGKPFPDQLPFEIRQLFGTLADNNIELFIHKEFFVGLDGKIHFRKKPDIFSKFESLKHKMDFFFSIGGDGTFLDTICFVRNSGTPILGINTGRLGFLASTSIDELPDAVQNIIQGHFMVEQRSLIRLETENNPFGEENFALNEISVNNRHDSSMITIHTWINGQYLASYWSDGLILSTPTGSTAYSLSCGGPIIVPDSQAFVITPIGPHNLSIRPVVIPDTCCITMKIEGRVEEILVNLDSKSKPIKTGQEINIRKETFSVNIIRFRDQNFFSTLRNKLLWGLDKRNV
ncbi:MAG: NAD kinase [Bacteroidetes bacterium]|nr:NAD kinase [Bacteroidota bacterium]MBU1718635.1 NAD kinase [Bacteroidota bacterium]